MVHKASRSTENNAHELMLDTGSDPHVCVDSSLMMNARDDDDTEFVTWNGDRGRAELVGDVRLLIDDAKTGQSVELSMDMVRYTGTGRCNILSLDQLERDGWCVHFAEEGPKWCWLVKDDKTLELPKVGNRYVLRAAGAKRTEVSAMAASVPIDVWHRRIAHLNYKALRAVLRPMCWTESTSQQRLSTTSA